MITKMELILELQRTASGADIPADKAFRRWVEAALSGRRESAELVIRVVDEEEGRQLNRRYRGKDSATNVLSFPFEAPAMVETELLGDLVVCAPVVVREAQEQAKAADAHWAHLTVHGLLHLLGFDHQNEREAAAMEKLEIVILAELGFPDPYLGGKKA